MLQVMFSIDLNTRRKKEKREIEIAVIFLVLFSILLPDSWQ